MSKFLDSNGLLYVWSKIKSYVSDAITNGITGKVDKVDGKGLSTNDYTTDEKNKLAGIEAGANNYTLPNASATVLGGIKVGDNLTIDSNGVLSAQDSYELPKATATVLGGVKVGSNLAVTSDGTLSGNYADATQKASGLMSAEDKTRLDGLVETGGEANQNAFSYVTVGSTKIEADSTTDTLTLVAGDHVTLTPNATNDSVTIAAPIDAATASKAGLMSSADKSKLDSIEANANDYTHPTYTAKSSGLYKVTVDGTGHVSATVAVAKADITGLGIPAQDTTYNNATTTTAGLMSSTDKSKLDGFGSADTYALKTDLSNVYTYKGSVAAVANLPTGATVGDVYNVEATGMNYAWTGTEWDALGEIMNVESITNSEIDTICA